MEKGRIPAILAIDPGLHKLGWAYWSDTHTVFVGTRPFEWGALTTKDLWSVSWKLRAHRMAERVAKVMKKCKPSLVICEMPEEWQSAKGQAALQSGNIRKLVYLVGLIGGRVDTTKASYYTVEPSKWKGQVPKEITRARIIRAYGPRFKEESEDTIDALGIGRWYHKKLRQMFKD